MKIASFVVSFLKNQFKIFDPKIKFTWINLAFSWSRQAIRAHAITVLHSTTMLFLFTNSFASEFTGAKCERVLKASGDIQIGRQWYEAEGRCYLDIHPMDILDLTYRDYLFVNDGGLLVFNAYGEGPTSTHTGARMYYFFPRTQDYPDYAIETNGDVTVQMVSGHLLKFDSQTMAINGSQDLTYLEDKKVVPSNRGGLELSPTKGLSLDLGFTLGRGPNEDPERESMFKDSRGERCRVKNKEIFKYSGDVALKFTDLELQRFLKKRCPKIDFTLK